DEAAVSVAATPGGRGSIALVTYAGSVYLVRPGRGGESEAVLLDAPRGAEGRAQAPWLDVAGGRVTALWLASARDTSELSSYRGPVPQSGWEPIRALIWKGRRGRGLRRADRMLLAHLVREEAEGLERRGRVEDAIERDWY